jgi:hypothetical protein
MRLPVERFDGTPAELWEYNAGTVGSSKGVDDRPQLVSFVGKLKVK